MFKPHPTQCIYLVYHIKPQKSWIWWNLDLVINDCNSSTERLRKKDHKFESTLSFTAILYLKDSRRVDNSICTYVIANAIEYF